MTSDRHLHLPDEAATDRAAAALARLLAPGDTVLLSGPVGAGKTHFARAVIRHFLGPDEHVPSPTFTLVQTYDTARGDIWHADLYRLGDPGEVEELGLTDAFANAICLVEWPDRLGELRPESALDAVFAYPDTGDGRDLTLRWSDARWTTRLSDCAA